MLEVADVLRRYGDAYLQMFGSQMLPSHRRAFYDILHCRTAAMGGHVYTCDQCGHEQYAYHSCKNRSCPKCQGDDVEIWLEQRRQELLATPYFHIVLTLPRELHEIVRRHQKKMYGVLMKAAACAMMKLAADPRYVGGRIGILAVLHTATRTLLYHPHVHLLVPAGAVTQDRCWLSSRDDYLIPVKALSAVFRGVFLQMARKELPHQQFPRAVWRKRWWIDCRATVQGTERILQYLGRYLYRIPFANSRLIRIDDGEVTFRYQKSGDRQWRIMTLPAVEFIRRLLQHVLPRGTHKIRYYGIWNPAHRQLLRQVQVVIGAAQIPDTPDDETTTEGDVSADTSCDRSKTCPSCRQGRLVLSDTIPRQPRPPP